MFNFIIKKKIETPAEEKLDEIKNILSAMLKEAKKKENYEDCWKFWACQRGQGERPFYRDFFLDPQSIIQNQDAVFLTCSTYLPVEISQRSME